MYLLDIQCVTRIKGEKLREKEEKFIDVCKPQSLALTGIVYSDFLGCLGSLQYYKPPGQGLCLPTVSTEQIINIIIHSSTCG